jgi:hypothetical protein
MLIANKAPFRGSELVRSSAVAARALRREGAPRTAVGARASPLCRRMVTRAGDIGPVRVHATKPRSVVCFIRGFFLLRKRGRPKPPPRFQLRFGLHLRNQQLAREGRYILPILRCPLLAKADISTRPLR